MIGASSGGSADASGTTPVDGLIEAMPQQWAGLRSEPPRSLPRPSGVIPLASALASPPLDPPAVTSGRHGLRVSPRSDESVCTRRPKSGRLVRANGIAPAVRMRSTTGASIGAVASASAGTPWVVGHPATSMFSFTVIGTPCNGPNRCAVDNGAVGRLGRLHRLVAEQGDDRVELAVDGVDAVDERVEHLAARRLPVADRGRDLQRTQLPQVSHRSIMTHSWLRPKRSGRGGAGSSGRGRGRSRRRWSPWRSAPGRPWARGRSCGGASVSPSW